MRYVAAVVAWLLFFCICIPTLVPVFHYHWYSSHDAVVVGPPPDHVGVTLSPQGIFTFTFYDFMMALILLVIGEFMLFAVVMGLLSGLVEGWIRVLCEKRLARQAAGMVIVAYSQLVMTGDLLVVFDMSCALSCMIGFMGLFSTAEHFHLMLDGISVACGSAVVQLVSLGQYTAQAVCATGLLLLCEVILLVGGDPEMLRGHLTGPIQIGGHRWPVSLRVEAAREPLYAGGETEDFHL